MILGACSLCGGCVELPDVWYSTVPPVPTCRGCQATKKLAVIEMTPSKFRRYGADATNRDFKAEAQTKFENYCDALRMDQPLDDAEFLNKVGNG